MERLELLPEALRGIVSGYWQQLQDSPEFQAQDLAALLAKDPAFIDEINRVFAASEFVATTLIREPILLFAVHESRQLQLIQYQQLLEVTLSDLADLDFKSGSEQLKRQLRRFHRREFIAILWRDFCGYLDVHQVCTQMSALADACLQCSLDLLHQWSRLEWGEPAAEDGPQSLVIIGMGKLGARELNVSSDIDLIFAYPRPGETKPGGDTSSITNQQYFTRLSQRLIDALDTVTADGFVFRVDMRLRPYGSEGALVLSFDAMEDYYQNEGRDWERYALIKGRIVAGDQAGGKELLKRLNPFVYRRYLDFGMFESLRDMKVQINKQSRRGKLDTDIKLGPGGIREVEFIVQALQLVHGGRDKLLQTPSITETMEQLQKRGYLPDSAVTELLMAYEFL
ncbi:MAG: bifunctional glutamine synthetase adenylyltransferase/deadenyltransferase, partial [Pseudohongiellaceae bacterium]